MRQRKDEDAEKTSKDQCTEMVKRSEIDRNRHIGSSTEKQTRGNTIKHTEINTTSGLAKSTKYMAHRRDNERKLA